MTIRAWTMITARAALPAVADEIHRRFGLRAYNVLGIYDAVVEFEASDVEEVKKILDQIEELDPVAANTTYLATSPKTKRKAKDKPFAYILVDAVPGESDGLRDRFFELEQVQKADIVLGPYDIIVEVAVDSYDELVNTLLFNFLGIQGIVKTVTLTVFESKV